MSKTIEDEAVDGMCMLSSSPGQSQLSPTNAAASRKDAKKKANRIAALRSRHKKHWEKEINKLNGKKRFTPERVRWCINQVTLVEKMNKQIQWEDVVQLSRSGTVNFYGSNAPKPMERAVIVRPHDSFDKPFPIEASRIQYKRPPQKTLKRSFQMQGVLVLQMTGPVSGDDGKYYILVKYEWNKELWWKPAEDVKELVPEGGRNKTPPNRFRPGEKNEPNHRRDQPEKLILRSVIAKPINIKRLNQAMTKSQQALKIPRVSGEVSLATNAGLAQIEGSAAWNSDIKELVELSLTYEVLRGLSTGKITILDQVLGSNVTNGYISALAISAKGLGEEEQKKPQHIKGEKKKCQEKGCTRQAHAHTNFTHCSKHSKSPRKVCVVCKKSKGRRKGGLCDACFVDNGKGFCANCTKSGYKRVPRNIGGLCPECITNGVKVIKKCKKCNVGRQRHKGGICQACFKISLPQGNIA